MEAKLLIALVTVIAGMAALAEPAPQVENRAPKPGEDRKQDAVDFVKELNITYPIALDPEAQVGSLYGAWGLPATYLIGPKGEGLARGWGPAEWYGNGARKLIKDLTDGKR